MDLIGKWKLHSMLTYDGGESGPAYAPIEDIIAKHPDMDDYRRMAEGGIDINEDGHIYYLMKVPEGFSEEELKAAIEEEGLSLSDNGMLIVDSQEWKTEGDKVMYDTGIHGEVLGEEVSSWAELKIGDDGLLEIVTSKYIRA